MKIVFPGDLRSQTWMWLTLIIMLGSHIVIADDSHPAGSAIRTPQDEEALRQAQTVFQSRDYWWKRTNELESPSIFGRAWTWIKDNILEPIFKAIGKLLEWLWDLIFGSQSTTGGDWSKGTPLAWVLLAILAGIVVWRLIVYLRNNPVASGGGEHSPEEVEQLQNSKVMLEEAQRLLAQQDFRQALRQAFLAFIAWLQEQGRLRYDPSRSNREYQRDLGKFPELRESFRSAAEPFERCWYGGYPPSAAQVEAIIAVCQRHLHERGASA